MWGSVINDRVKNKFALCRVKTLGLLPSLHGFLHILQISLSGLKTLPCYTEASQNTTKNPLTHRTGLLLRFLK